MKITELQIGDKIEFINDDDVYGVSEWNPRMRAKISSIRKDEEYGDDCYEVAFDSTAFLDHNKEWAERNFYDKDGRAILNAFEAGFYPKNGIHLTWIGANANIFKKI